MSVWWVDSLTGTPSSVCLGAKIKIRHMLILYKLQHPYLIVKNDNTTTCKNYSFSCKWICSNK